MEPGSSHVKFNISTPQQIISHENEISQPLTQQTQIPDTLTTKEMNKPQRTPKSGGLPRRKSVGIFNTKELSQKDNNTLAAQKIGNSINNNSALSKEAISTGRKERLEKLSMKLSPEESEVVSKRYSQEQKLTKQSENRLIELKNKESLTKSEVEELRALPSILKKDKLSETATHVLNSAEELVSDGKQHDSSTYNLVSKECWKSVALVYKKQEENGPESKETSHLEELAHNLEKAADKLEAKAKDVESDAIMEEIRLKQTMTTEKKESNNQLGNINLPYTFIVSDRDFNKLNEFHQLEVMKNEANELLKHYKTIKNSESKKLQRFNRNENDLPEHMKSFIENHPYEKSANKEERDVIVSEIIKNRATIEEIKSKREASSKKKEAKGKI